jgi:hypothetical protein
MSSLALLERLSVCEVYLVKLRLPKCFEYSDHRDSFVDLSFEVRRPQGHNCETEKYALPGN